MRQGKWAKPLCPRQQQSRTSGAPESSGPSSRQIQQDAPSGGVKEGVSEGDDDELLIIRLVGGYLLPRQQWDRESAKHCLRTRDI